jgi:ABC-type amino acid transport substrate-binding protein
MRFLYPLLLILLTTLAVAEPLQVRYAPGQAQTDRRYAYYWELLDAALAANQDSMGPYRMVAESMSMSPPRAVAEVARDGLINIIVRTANASLETSLRPIRIPLDKGLTGYRLFLIDRDTQPALDGVRNLADLAHFGIGQDRNWVDVQVLRAAGLTVVEGEGYDGLFQMLRAGRFPLFSRGVNEIADELAAQQANFPKLAIEKHLVLYYPLPRYFYVARNDDGEKLAQRIEDGLLKLIQRGEFDRRYREYKKLVLANLDLSGRTVFRIPNPTLSPETPLARKAWWDDLATELK